MNRLKYVLLFLFMLAWENASAHTDVVFSHSWDFGNVKVRLLIEGGNNEEVKNKVEFIGKMAEYFVKQLNCSYPILLDFNYYYIKDCETDCFLSYNKNNTIVVEQFGNQLDAQTTLKLLEYAISNKKKIKSSQTIINYNKYYYRQTIQSINTTLIQQILCQPNSDNLDMILNLKFNKNKDDFKFGFSYYLQNNKYTLFFRDYDKDTNLLTLDNIHQLEIINDYAALVFDSDTSFYFVDENKISPRHIIQNVTYYGITPFKIEYRDEQKIIIVPTEMYSLGGVIMQNKYLLYFTEEDKLIQDIDKEEIKKLINERRNE